MPCHIWFQRTNTLLKLNRNNRFKFQPKVPRSCIIDFCLQINTSYLSSKIYSIWIFSFCLASFSMYYCIFSLIFGNNSCPPLDLTLTVKYLRRSQFLQLWKFSKIFEVWSYVFSPYESILFYCCWSYSNAYYQEVHNIIRKTFFSFIRKKCLQFLPKFYIVYWW